MNAFTNLQTRYSYFNKYIKFKKIIQINIKNLKKIDLNNI